MTRKRTAQEWIDGAAQAMKDVCDADWLSLQDVLPNGTQLTVMSTTADGRIYVRWHSQAGMTNEACLVFRPVA